VLRQQRQGPLMHYVLPAHRHHGGQWLLSQRLSLVQRMLETNDQPIERIAERAGFGTALSMRQHFDVAFHTTPSMYQREFRGV
jgi:transcriptional regulator GlxA family with amidase domain